MKKLLLFLFILSAFTVNAQTTGYKVGDKATDFNLKNIDGKQVSLSNYEQAKGYVVVFTCNTCPYSIAYEDRIIALHNKYAPLGYPVVAINPNDPNHPGESYVQMQERSQSKGFPFVYLSDPNQVYTKAYGANRTPHTFILNKTAEGNIVEYIGAIDSDTDLANGGGDKFVELALNNLLENKKPALNFTKAIGCTIKWTKAAL